MVALTIAGTVAAFNYIDDQTNNALSSYAKHRFETAADYVTNGAWKKLFNKTNEKLKGKTIEQDPNLEFIDEILENTKLQTDDSLLDLWASLLANAMQGRVFIRREYFDIISKLNPYDVLVLNTAMNNDYEGYLKRAIDLSQGNSTAFNSILGRSLEEFKINDVNERILSVNYLKNLGVFADSSVGLRFYLTPLGKALKKALSMD